MHRQSLTMGFGMLSIPDIILSFKLLEALIMPPSVISCTHTFILLNVVKSVTLSATTFRTILILLFFAWIC